MRSDSNEAPTALHAERLDAVVQCLLDSKSRSVADLGCGGAELLVRLAATGKFEKIAGVDSSSLALRNASAALEAAGIQNRVSLVHASYTDLIPQIVGFEAVCLVETIEHVHPSKLSAVEHAVFGYLAARCVIVTTPNQEFNVLHGIPPNRFRHPDHLFEWTRAKFRGWASGVAERNSYRVRFEDVGDFDPILGSSTQMAVFNRS